MSVHYSLQVIRVQGITWDSRSPGLYVEVKLGDVTKRTRTIEDISQDWEETFVFSSSDTSTKFNIRVKEKKELSSKDIDIAALLKECAGGKSEAQLSLSSGKTSADIIHVRFEEVDTVRATRLLIDEAKNASKKLEHGTADAVDSTVSAATDGAKEMKPLCDSFVKLLSKLDAVVQIVDEVSKVVSRQFKIDQALIELVAALDDAFEFANDADTLPEKTRNLKDTVDKLLQQTYECCLFVQEYTSHGFIERTLKIRSNQKIADFKARFADLKKALDSNIGLHTAFVSARILEAVDEIIIDQRLSGLQQRLLPDENDASDRPSCLPGTRSGILTIAMDWIFSNTSQNIMWLHGVAGSGKSTVSMTIAERCLDLLRRGAYLFFVREKSNPKAVIRTIAYWLASFDDSIAKHVAKAVKANNGIENSSLSQQFEKLLLQPLTAAAPDMYGPVVIVLDALDECGTEDTRRDLLAILRTGLPKLPKDFRFIITSRREPDIRRTFSHQPSVREIELDYRSPASRNDVRRYIDHEMRSIFVTGELEIPANWDYNVDLLGNTSEGLFIWASTAVKLILKNKADPFPALERLLSCCQRNELDTSSPSGFGLDNLYDTVLEWSEIQWTDEESKTRFSRVLGLILMGKSTFSIGTIDEILGFPSTSSSRLIIDRLQSVLAYTPDSLDPQVRLFHTSFSDYLTSPMRSGDPWFIDVSREKRMIASRCFAVMTKLLRFNICDLETSYVRNDDVAGLGGLIKEKKKIPAHLEYTCIFWAHHLHEAPVSPELLGELSDFLRNRLLYWFEVLGLLKRVDVASLALSIAIDWVPTPNAETLKFLKDARRQIDVFATAILASTPHIYLSMLPLALKGSEIFAHYSKNIGSVVQVERRGDEGRSALLKLLLGHTSTVSSIAFSPDGTRIASGSYDRTIRVWDAASGEVVSRPFEGHTSSVSSVAFSPDGTRIASGSGDSTIKVWDAAIGEVVSGPFEGHTDSVLSVAFSPDGTRIVSGSGDSTIRVWDAATGEVVSGPFEGGSVLSVAFSPDGTRIVSGSGDCTIRVWDAAIGEVVSGPLEGHTDSVLSVAFSPDGTRIVSGSGDCTIRVWDAAIGEVVSRPFEGHTGSVSSVAFSPDGIRIASGSWDSTIRVWDVATGKVVSGPFEGHTDSVLSVAFSPDGTRIASGSWDSTIRVWDAAIGEVVSRPFEGHTDSVLSVAFSPDGTRIASGSSDSTIRVWDAAIGEVVSRPFEGHTGSVSSVAFSPDGTRIVSGSGDSTIKVWDAATGEVVSRPFEGHTGSVSSVAFSPDGIRIASGSSDSTIRVWDAAIGEAVSGPFKGHTSSVSSVAFSPDGTRIVSGSSDSTIRVWDATSGGVVSGPFEGHTGSVSSVAFSPDGTRIASGSWDSTIRVWDAAIGEVVSRPFEGHTNSVLSVAFSPDGTCIASGSWDSTIRVWDAATGEVVSRPFEGHTGSVSSVAFSPDGTRIASGSGDSMIRVWDAATREVVSGPFEGHADRVLSVAFSPDDGTRIASGSDDNTIKVSEVKDEQVVSREAHTRSVSSSDSNVVSDWTLADDGWIRSQKGYLLLWVPPHLRPTLWRTRNTAVFSCAFSTKLDFRGSAHGNRWYECFDPSRKITPNSSSIVSAQPIDELSSENSATDLSFNVPGAYVSEQLHGSTGIESSHALFMSAALVFCITLVLFDSRLL